MLYLHISHLQIRYCHLSPYDINARFSSQLLRREAVVHSRRACRDYLRELSSFVRARLGDQLQLPLPQLEAGPEDSSRQQLEASLATRGWAAVDWSTRRLSRQQLSAAMEAAATLHAAGLAFRIELAMKILEVFTERRGLSPG